MRAIDTNVLARFILNDDVDQGKVARRVIEDGAFLPLTVVLELGWLLASRYGFSRDAIAEMLAGVIDLPTLTVFDQARLSWAIDQYALGGDLPDLLHLIGSGPADRFCTFDAGIARAAGSDIPVEIETLA